MIDKETQEYIDKKVAEEIQLRAKQFKKNQALNRENFSPGVVPQDALYGSVEGIILSKLGATQNLTTSVAAQISYDDTPLYYRGSAISWNTSNDTLTIVKSGLYLVTLSWNFDTNTGGGVGDYGESVVEYASPTFGTLGTNKRLIDSVEFMMTVSGSRYSRGQMSALLPVKVASADDYTLIRSFYFQSSGATAVVRNDNSPANSLSVIRLSDVGQRLFSDVGEL